MKPKTPKKTRKRKSIKTECDKLWADIVKAKAGYKSEYSGKSGKQIGGDAVLNAHHLRGKSSYRLRYEISNGYCCTSGEHCFGFHHSERRTKYEEKVKEQRGHDIFDKLEMLRHFKSNDIRAIKLYLEKVLETYS